MDNHDKLNEIILQHFIKLYQYFIKSTFRKQIYVVI